MVECEVRVSQLATQMGVFRRGAIIDIDEEKVKKLGNSVRVIVPPEPAPFLASKEPPKTVTDEVLLEETPQREETENVRRQGQRQEQGRKPEVRKGRQEEVNSHEPQKKPPSKKK